MNSSNIKHGDHGDISHHPHSNSNERVIAHTHHWLQQGQPVWLATVVATYGSSPRPVGSLMAYNPQQGFVGSLSGGCLEQDLIDQLQHQRIGADEVFLPRIFRYGESEIEQQKYRLPCGGTLDVLLEYCRPHSHSPHQNYSEHIAAMHSAASQRQAFQRQVQFNGDLSFTQPSDIGEQSQLSKQGFCHIYRPQYRLLIIGAGDIAHHLASLAMPAGFSVSICDFRPEFLQGFSCPSVEIIEAMPDELIVQQFNDGYCAIAALAHDPRLDDMALLEAVNGPAFYLGAMGSQASSHKRRKRLAELGLSTTQLDRIHAPIGLPIQSKTPYEIAIAVIAHILQCRPL